MFIACELRTQNSVGRACAHHSYTRAKMKESALMERDSTIRVEAVLADRVYEDVEQGSSVT